jgi:hypothetical protein
MSRFAILLLAMTALTACKGAPQFPVEVSLEIEGQSFEYTSSQGEFDDHGGPLSVYLLPDDFKDGSSPYACLRFYSGNPVGHFWVRYSAEGEEAGNSRPRFECFVPGTLSDGTETLTWTKDDGEERHRTETGEATCKVSLTRQGDDVILEFDVVAQQEKRGKGGHGGGGEEGEEHQGPVTITASGRGVLKLGPGVLKDDAELPVPWMPETVAEPAPTPAPVEVPAADDDDSGKADDDDSGKAEQAAEPAVDPAAEPAVAPAVAPADPPVAH